MPHVCGDEPPYCVPRVACVGVCPTYVGMNRASRGVTGLVNCMPHVCGDEPLAAEHKRTMQEYAPRMWG